MTREEHTERINEIIKRNRQIKSYIETQNNKLSQVRDYTPADVEEAFQSLYAAETILLENTFAARPESQRLLMRALANEPTSRFHEAYRDRHSLPPTATTNTALRRLVRESIVEKADGAYVLTDPLLTYHLKSRT